MWNREYMRQKDRNKITPVKTPNRIEGSREQSDSYKQQAASAAMLKEMMIEKK